MKSMRKLATLGHKIKSSRVAAGYSQKELAHVLRLSDKSISAYEVNRAQPSLRTLKKIAETVKQPLSFFTDDQINDLSQKINRIENELAEIKAALAAQAQSKS